MNSRHQGKAKHFTLTPLCLLLVGTAAQATDGYFANGYGMNSIGMGGTAVAVSLEPFGGAVNPGAMSFLGNQWQAGLSWFSPDRDASRSGSGPAGLDGSATSGSTNFFIPEFGINWKYSPELAFGLTVYGNGGMNTNFPGGQIPAASACANFNPGQAAYNLLCGTGNLGVDLMQLMIAPYVSWQFTKGHSIGIAPTLAYQRFEANGLQAFDNPALSTKPGSVTNNGYSDSWGGGVRIGYMGQINEMFSVGAAYATKMSM
ncbi:MAG: long-chain fatty acid transport protein, partial [Proteobacteria bacterium]|nr:long-chain fatty acid transport protein [Pseudomonadota bacterium]